jgi:hypothetical protein
MSKRLTREEMREYQRNRRAGIVKPECKAPVKPLLMGVDIKPIVKPIGEDSLAIIVRLTERIKELEGEVLRLRSKRVPVEDVPVDLFQRVVREKEMRLRV